MLRSNACTETELLGRTATALMFGETGKQPQCPSKHTLSRQIASGPEAIKLKLYTKPSW